MKKIIMFFSMMLFVTSNIMAQSQAEIEAAKEALLKQQSANTQVVTSGSGNVTRVMPQFPGGNVACSKYLSDSLRYPAKSKADKVEGRVIVSFYVNTDGSLSDIMILKSLNEECDAEAIRLIKAMPKWEPYKEIHSDGTVELVKCKFTLPIEFLLVARDFNRVN
ncbi:MAG: energy transducer TonB [Bacteroidaceae bacterium]|nr:energy transducer TonB [Bacteroidaceae bacterium]